jgi:hypothetical protein
MKRELRPWRRAADSARRSAESRRRGGLHDAESFDERLPARQMWIIDRFGERVDWYHACVRSFKELYPMLQDLA